jgi:hypothetical protein
VTGIVGIFFTYLTARQGRKQVAELAIAAENRARREKLETERRNAFMAVLRLVRINAYRAKYERRVMRSS